MSNKYITILILGSSNTGKSSIFNYFIGQNVSAIENHFLTTRDIISSFFKLGKYIVKLIDTPGLFILGNSRMQKKIFYKCFCVIKKSNIILVVIDASNFTNNDIKIIELCSKFAKPVVLIVNKIDKHSSGTLREKFLNIKKYKKYYISIKHKKGINLLTQYIYNLCLKYKKNINYYENKQYKYIIKVAIIGQSNVGKSTFLNTLIGNNRHLVDNSYFTTTDPILTTYVRNNIKILFTDTAGINHSSKNSFENIFINFSFQLIKKSDIIIFMTDIFKIMSREDRRIISILNRNIKPFLFVVNKIDIIKEKKESYLYMKKNKPILLKKKIYPISSLDKKCTEDIASEVILLFYKSRIKIKTDELNIMLGIIIKENPHPLVEKKCLKIYFIKQISNYPPKFIIYTNLHSSKIKKNYKQFIMKLLSKKIFMGFIPIKIFFLKKLEIY